MIEKYYEILGVSPQDDIKVIKAAYRKKAKLLHPDKNPSPDAHEQFVLLNEAYEYFLNPTDYYFEENITAEQTAREEAKARAAEYAKMKYNEFINSPFYREINAWETVATHLYILIVGVIFTALLTIMAFLTGIFGFLFFLIIGISLFYFLFTETDFTDNISIVEFYDAVVYLLTSKSLLGVVLTFINLILIITCVFRTLMITSAIVLLYISAAFIAYFYQKKVNKKTYQESKMYIYIVAPFIVSLLFAFNYLLSFHPREEVLLFKTDINVLYYPDAPQYNKYYTMRWFNHVEKAKKIHFIIREGILGVDVITDYEFEVTEPDYFYHIE